MRSIALALAFIVLASMLMLLGPDTIPAHDQERDAAWSCRCDTCCETLDRLDAENGGTK